MNVCVVKLPSNICVYNHGLLISAWTGERLSEVGIRPCRKGQLVQVLRMYDC